MKIIIEADKLKDPFSGLGNYCHNLITNLINQETDYQFEVYSSHLREFAFIGHNSSQWHRYMPNKLPKADLWHLTHQESPFVPLHSKYVMTIHDMNYFYRDKNKLLKEKYRLALQLKIKKSSGLVFISDFALKETERFFDLSKKKVKRIYNGVEHSKKSSRPYLVKEGRPFLFTISKLLEKKNIHVLFEMMKQLPEYDLYVGGGLDTEYAQFLVKKAGEMGLKKQILFLGTLSLEEKAWCFENCLAYLFPSLFEGFGITPIEAMYYGKPVFASRENSIPEVCGDAAFYFNDFDPKDMLDVFHKGMEEFQNNEDEMKRAIMEHCLKYTWEKSSKEYLDFYTEVINHS